jgi:excisionase family DNA binding protein
VTGPLLTVPEVADLLGCSPKSVERMMARGDLPKVKLSARMVRVRAEDVQRLIEGHLETASTAGTALGTGPTYPAGSRWWADG